VASGSGHAAVISSGAECGKLSPLKEVPMPTTIEPVTLETIEAAALQLSAADHALLLERLIVRLDADPELDQAWLAEAQRRDEEAEKDPSLWLSGPEVLAEVQGELR
jgi:hypothetical protein